MPSKSFKDLVVWQKSVALAQETYALTNLFPRHEQFGLGSQLNRATVSIASNIAEGSKRGTVKDFNHFLRIASGSAAEVETQLLIAKNIYKDISYKKVDALLDEVQRMLTVMVRKVR